MVEVDLVAAHGHCDRTRIQRTRMGWASACRSTNIEHGITWPHGQRSAAHLDHTAIGDGDAASCCIRCAVGYGELAGRLEAGSRACNDQICLRIVDAGIGVADHCRPGSHDTAIVHGDRTPAGI
ncbi:Uncharacterised protein [Brucella melitensis]|nr:Uncharacterised protein [Brucella melitensis]